MKYATFWQRRRACALAEYDSGRASLQLGVSVKPVGLIKHHKVTNARLLDATIFRKGAGPEVVEQ